MTKLRGGSSGTRFPGHLRARNGHHDHAFWLLLREYAAYRPFRESWYELRLQLEAGASDKPMLLRWAHHWNLDRLPALGGNSCATLYYDLLPRTPRLRAANREPFGTIMLRAWVPPQPALTYGDHRWVWQLSTRESLGALRTRIASELGASKPGRLPAAVQDELRALPEAATAQGWVLGDAHSAVSDHVHWLFLHRCPQPDRPLSYSKILDRLGPDADKRNLRRAIHTLACVLEIAPSPSTAQPGLPSTQQT